MTRWATLLFFTVVLTSIVTYGQTYDKLGKRTDSILSLSFANKQLTQEQFSIFHQILDHRAGDFKKRIDSANYDYVIIEEEINTRKKTFRTVETYIAKGFEDKVCVDNKCEKPAPGYKGVRDTDSRLIHNWSYKTVDTLYPAPIVFTQGCIANIMPKTKRKMERAEKKEKRSGGYLPPVYKIITVINLNANKTDIAFFVPTKKIREVKFVCISGP